MRILGKINKVGDLYAVEIPALQVYTQGFSVSHAHFMAKDALESLINVPNFYIGIIPLDDFNFEVISENNYHLVTILGL